MVARPPTAYWQRFYDQRAAQCSPGEFMRVLGYNPGPDRTHEALFASMLAEIRLRLRPAPEHRFLDIGCGYGVFTRALAQETRLAVGTDLAQMMMRRGRELAGGCRSMPSVAQAQAQAEHQPFAGAVFDRILCFSVLFYLQAAAVRLLVAEILRLLRPGGRALIGDVLHPRRLHFECSYIGRVPPVLYGPLCGVLRAKGTLNSWRGRMTYQAYSPDFFERLLPAGVGMEVYNKADGRRNNAARYDLVLHRW